MEFCSDRYNQTKDRVVYSSYNCFGSALGSYLYVHNVPQEDVRLSMDLQWQFFYHDVPDYSSENRIVGEYPYICDESLNDQLQSLTGYQFHRCMNGRYDLSDVDADIQRNGQAILFVNKKEIGEALNMAEKDDSVTTILVELSQENGKYQVHKPNFFGVTKHDIFGVLTKEQLKRARFTSVKGYDLCGERILCEKIENVQPVNKHKLIVAQLLQTIDNYLMSQHKQLSNLSDCWFGRKGMEKFSEQVEGWVKKYDNEDVFRRLDFGAMGLIFVKRQRLIFFQVLSEILKGTYVSEEFFQAEEERMRQEILNLWGDVRIYMRIISYKKSIIGLQKVKQYISLIKELECEYLESLKNYIIRKNS